MKKLTIILLTAISTLMACNNKSKFTISGKLENANVQEKVYLHGMINNMMMVLDSTNLSPKGEFKFTNTKPETDFFRISFGPNEYIVLAKNGDKVEITADATDRYMQYTVQGSDDAAKLTEFNTLRQKHRMALQAISNEFEQKVAANPDKREELVEQLSPVYSQAVEELNQAIIKFAMDNPKSLVGFYAITSVNPMGNEDALIDYVEKIDEQLKQHAAIKSFAERMARLKTVQVGAVAPEFTINGIDGQSINLSDYRGKYLLLDFWASWCGPCRVENPNIVRAYNKYKNRNFTILGISLDKDKVAWQNAIKQDKLTWGHAGELNDFEGPTVRLYQVEAIPSAFLIDPQGKIIAKNLTGNELDDFLNKNLPHSN